MKFMGLMTLLMCTLMITTGCTGENRSSEPARQASEKPSHSWTMEPLDDQVNTATHSDGEARKEDDNLLQSTPWKRPENVFVLNPQHAAFVIIDMQNFSCDPDTGRTLPRISEVIARINKLADFCRENGIPVIWVRQSISSTGTGNNAGLYPLFHDKNSLQIIMNRGPGTDIYPALHFDPAHDHVVFKNRYSAFLANPPELQEKLDFLNKSQLIIAGVAANVCVESTLRDAMQLDYEVVLVSDGVTADDDTLLNSTLENTRLFFGDVRTVDDILEDLARKTA